MLSGARGRLLSKAELGCVLYSIRLENRDEHFNYFRISLVISSRTWRDHLRIAASKSSQIC